MRREPNYKEEYDWREHESNGREDIDELRELREKVRDTLRRNWLKDFRDVPTFGDTIQEYINEKAKKDEGPRDFWNRVIEESKNNRLVRRKNRNCNEQSCNSDEADFQSGYNSWPFGEVSDAIWPNCLIVCVGRTRLFTALEIVKDYSNKMAQRFSNADSKSVIVITDKWNPDTFAKFELDMLRHVVNANFRYDFFLATDYDYKLVLSLADRI